MENQICENCDKIQILNLQKEKKFDSINEIKKNLELHQNEANFFTIWNTTWNENFWTKKLEYFSVKIFKKKPLNLFNKFSLKSINKFFLNFSSFMTNEIYLKITFRN